MRGVSMPSPCYVRTYRCFLKFSIAFCHEASRNYFQLPLQKEASIRDNYFIESFENKLTSISMYKRNQPDHNTQDRRMVIADLPLVKPCCSFAICWEIKSDSRFVTNKSRSLENHLKSRWACNLWSVEGISITNMSLSVFFLGEGVRNNVLVMSRPNITIM